MFVDGAVFDHTVENQHFGELDQNDAAGNDENFRDVNARFLVPFQRIDVYKRQGLTISKTGFSPICIITRSYR